MQAYTIASERFQARVDPLLTDPLLYGVWEALMAHTLAQLGVKADRVLRRAQVLPAGRAFLSGLLPGGRNPNQELYGVQLHLPDGKVVVCQDGLLGEATAARIGARHLKLSEQGAKAHWTDPWEDVLAGDPIYEYVLRDFTLLRLSTEIARETMAVLVAGELDATTTAIPTARTRPHL